MQHWTGINPVTLQKVIKRMHLCLSFPLFSNVQNVNLAQHYFVNSNCLLFALATKIIQLFNKKNI